MRAAQLLLGGFVYAVCCNSLLTIPGTAAPSNTPLRGMMIVRDDLPAGKTGE